jgi:hypothetical protein
MDVEIVHRQADGLCLRVLKGQLEDDLSEFKRRPIRRSEGEMTPALGSTGLEFAALSRNPTGGRYAAQLSRPLR